ncbi:hypothetical protein SESBI_46414 [Sesbania bispinosa]|nr:hypothetical protein SESBI_46414 [Sesbania bispinosa]
MGSVREIGGEIVEEPNPAVVDEPIYVAMAKEVKESKLNLIWAIQNSRGKRICILYVHVPATMIPLMGAKFPASSLKEQEVRAFREIERQNMHKTLDEYLRICQRMGKLHIEMDSIEKGIIELISHHGMEWKVTAFKWAVVVLVPALNRDVSKRRRVGVGENGGWVFSGRGEGRVWTRWGGF